MFYSQIQTEEQETSPTTVNTVVTTLTDLLHSSTDLAIQNTVIWRLAQLYLVASSNASSNSSGRKHWFYIS